jgi:hypothetical protein
MIRYTSNVGRQPMPHRNPLPEPTAYESPAESTAPDPRLADDLLRGADAIATFVFGSPAHRRKVYYYASDAKFRMPVFRIGTIICARKSTLIEWIERQERLR